MLYLSDFCHGCEKISVEGLGSRLCYTCTCTYTFLHILTAKLLMQFITILWESAFYQTAKCAECICTPIYYSLVPRLHPNLVACNIEKKGLNKFYYKKGRRPILHTNVCAFLVVKLIKTFFSILQATRLG